VGLQTHLPVEILDYVQTHEPADDVYGISQRELARALGYHPCSMSRPLGELVESGFLTSSRGLVREGKRRQLTYRLTPAGKNRLRQETNDVPLLSGELPPPPNPFLGRKEELDALGGFWASGGSVTSVDGPAGMGKTALVSRFLRRSRDGHVPFWYVARASSPPRHFVGAVAHALSFLGKPQLAYYSSLPRTPLARECADLVDRALEGRSLAMVVDDFHQAETDLRGFILEFVSALASRGSNRFYLIGQGLLDADFGAVQVHHLTVGGIDRAAAFELTSRLGGLADRFETIYQATLGSPLLLRLAVARPEAASQAYELPSIVVSQLKAPELRAILPAVVANEPIPAQFILEDRVLSPERIKDLATVGILQLGLHDRVEVLQTIRGAVLARVEPGDERIAHRRLARFYGRSHRPETLRERFLHLVAGEEWKVAAELVRTHERELLRLGYSDVLRGAIRTLVTALPAGPAKVRAYLVEGTLLRQHANYAEAVLSYRRAMAQAGTDDRVRREALLAIVDLEIRLGQVETAEQEFRRASQITATSRSLEAFVELTKARLKEAGGSLTEAAQGYQRAFEMARRARSQDIAFESIAAWSKFAELTSGPRVALEVVQAALPGARQSGRMDLAFNLRLVRARAYSELGDQRQAEAEVEATRTEAESLGYLTQLAYALSGLSAVATERGQWAESAMYAKQASELAERLGNNIVLGHTLALLCTSERRQASSTGSQQLLYEAEEHGKRSVEVLGRVPPSDSLAIAHVYLVEVYLALKQPSEALAHYNRARSLCEELGLKAIAARMAQELEPAIEPLIGDRPVAH
jgi:tetratricopeptide (TPR) repeat protein/DNA-binding MarR family transcriptional regulator